MDGYTNGIASNGILLSDEWNGELIHKVTRVKLYIIMDVKEAKQKKIIQMV